MADKTPRQLSESDASIEMNKPVHTENPHKEQQTQLTNPPTGQVKMTSAEPAAKIKIKAVRTILVKDLELGVDREVQPGETVTVSQKDAAEFCDRTFRGFYPYSGERYEDKAAGKIVRAVRV